VLNAAIVWRGYWCEAESRPCGLALLVVHRVKTLWLRLVRNDRKRHYPRCRPGVFVFVVAQQVQDMSAVSIAHKTLGIRLPRLWCGAVGWRTKLSINRTGPKLDVLTAEKVFGWKNVHQHDGALVGKKQDKAGRWRRAKVPSYSTEPLHAYAIEERMKQLGKLDRYQKELSKIN
jgi:hypothetical protein